MTFLLHVGILFLARPDAFAEVDALAVENTLSVHPIGSPSSTSFGHATEYIEFQNKLYFATDTNQFMAIDPFADPTPTLVRQFNERIQQIVTYDNRMYITVGDNPDSAELWRSDGAPGGTDMFWNRPTEILTVFRDRLYLASRRSNGNRWNIYVSDGGQPRNLGEQYNYQGVFFELNGDLHIDLTDSTNSLLGPYWIINADGDLETVISPIGVIQADSPFIPSNFPDTENGPVYYFRTFFDGEESMYRTDGIPRNTEKVVPLDDIMRDRAEEIRRGFGPRQRGRNLMKPFYVTVGGLFYFTGNDLLTGVARAYRTTGITSETDQLEFGRIGQPIDISDPRDLHAFNGQVYYSAIVDNRGRELVVSDDQPETSRVVVELIAGPGDSNPQSLTVFKDKLLFWANVAGSDADTVGLYATDGTESGTELIDTFDASTAGTPIKVLGDRVFITGRLSAEGSSVELLTLLDVTDSPTSTPTIAPSDIPSFVPSASPSRVPSKAPSMIPSVSPSMSPSQVPSAKPSAVPTPVTPYPSATPTVRPSASPSMSPSEATDMPSSSPTHAPTVTARPTQLTAATNDSRSSGSWRPMSSIVAMIVSLVVVICMF